MGRRKRTLLIGCGALSLAVGLVGARAGVGPRIVQAWSPNRVPAIQRHLWDSAASENFNDNGPTARVRSERRQPALRNYYPSGSANTCSDSLGSNVKVDQGCLNLAAITDRYGHNLEGRSQAHNETAIAVNPANHNQLVAASNDYKLGDGLDGGTSYSSDGGRTWQNSEVPLQFSPGGDFLAGPRNQCSSTPEPGPPLRMYWQGGGDPSIAWDTKGNVYFAGLHFHRGSGVTENPDYSSGVYVQRSTGNGGASWNFPGAAAATCSQPAGSVSGALVDKPYMTIDDTPGSPLTDRIYVTWTFFAATGTAYIYEAYSADYGRSFSDPVLVSQTSTLCPQNYSFIGVTPESGNNCDENQFSQPFVGPDHALYVVFANYNTLAATSASGENSSQMLLEKSSDGGQSFGPPVRVGTFNDLPDCAAYQGGQDAGRSCVPEQGSQQESVFRAANYPSGGVDPTDPSRVAITYGSYINRNSNPSTGCAPAGTTGVAGFFTPLYSGVKTSACANKILLSVSTDGGGSFTGNGSDPSTVTTIPQAPAQAHADQWFQWAGFNASGTLAVSYYDRSYGSDITNGDMDVTLSATSGSRWDVFTQQRVTTSSMPLPTQFPNKLGNSTFFGDYTGLAVADEAYPLWADTREPDLVECGGGGPPAVCTFIQPGSGDDPANNQDIFTDRVGLGGGAGNGG